METPKKDEWPPVPPALVDRLDQAFPDRVPGVSLNPKPDVDMAELYRRQGEQRVIRKLKSVLASQTADHKVL